MEKTILVYIQIKNDNVLLGTVFVDNVRGKEAYSFAYSDNALLNNYSNYIIDEEIMFTKGRQFKSDSSIPYHFLEDSSPDRWGRNLIKRNASQKNLQFSDYLLGVSDLTRMGALRYKLVADGPFLGEDNNIPSLEYLNKFEKIAFSYDEFDTKKDWKLLLSPGSSLGGARPKATFYDSEGNYYLAKFNHKDDEYDISKIEYLTYKLAIKCGIEMSESKLIQIDEKRSVFLTKRFDRNISERYHYVSFMTLLNARDGDSSNHTYLEAVESLLTRSDQPQQDLEQLFKRIAFSIIFHNYDNHLRNHGLLLTGGKWKLSPCFDINIFPYNGQHALTVDGNEMTIDNLLENSLFFRISRETANGIVEQIKIVAKTCLSDICQELKVNKTLTKRLKGLIIAK